MTDTQKLADLIYSHMVYKSFDTADYADWLADELISDGVIVPPCKVGDVVYYIEGGYYRSTNLKIKPIKVTEISLKNNRSGKDLGWAIIANGTRYKFSSFGKTVFFTREEAEQALKERGQ